MDAIRKKKIINVSIALFFIWAFCISIYFAFIYFVSIPLLYSIIIIASETFLSFSVWLFFMIKIDWLKDMNTGREITHLNISNALSAIRFTLVPLLITMFGLLTKTDGHYKFRIGIFTFAVVVCLTDLIDGFLARKLNQVTKLGMILDPFGDFLMIVCFSILIFVNDIITWWFFTLIMIRIPGLVVFALILLALDKKFKVKTTFLGKTTIFYILSHLGISTIKLILNLNNYYYDMFIFITQIIGAAVIIASSIEKIVQYIIFLKNKKNLEYTEKINF